MYSDHQLYLICTQIRLTNKDSLYLLKNNEALIPKANLMIYRVWASYVWGPKLRRQREI